MSARRRSAPQSEAEAAEGPVEPEAVEERAEELAIEGESDVIVPLAREVVEEPVVQAETEEEVPPGPMAFMERVKLQQENTAMYLSFLVVGIFALITLCVVLCGFGTSLVAFLVATYKGTEAAVPTFDGLEAAKILLPYLATPLGVAMGYYFTKRAAAQQQ
jgi:hypothetical protein